MKPLKIIPRPPAPTVLATASLTSAACAQRSSAGVSHDLIAPDRVTTLGKESRTEGGDQAWTLTFGRVNVG